MTQISWKMLELLLATMNLSHHWKCWIGVAIVVSPTGQGFLLTTSNKFKLCTFSLKSTWSSERIGFSQQFLFLSEGGLFGNQNDEFSVRMNKTNQQRPSVRSCWKIFSNIFIPGLRCFISGWRNALSTSSGRPASWRSTTLSVYCHWTSSTRKYTFFSGSGCWYWQVSPAWWWSTGSRFINSYDLSFWVINDVSQLMA